MRLCFLGSACLTDPPPPLHTMRKQTKRRKWGLLANPVGFVIENVTVAADKDLNKLRLLELTSLESMTKGHGTKHEWKTLNEVNNICQTMSEMGIGPEALPTVKLVEQHLIDAAARWKRTGKMGLTGPGIQAIKDMLEYHDLQRQSVPRKQYEEAIRLTLAHAKCGHAQKVEDLI